MKDQAIKIACLQKAKSLELRALIEEWLVNNRSLLGLQLFRTTPVQSYAH